MTERQIVNRVKKLQDLQAQINEINKAADIIKNEILSAMQGVEHLAAGDYIINYVNVISNRLDTSRIKKELPDIYKQYVKECHSQRFSISKK